MWTDHSDFLDVIYEEWQSHVEGTSMFILCRKLKCMKGPLRQLIKLHFSYIFERVVKAEVALDHYQTLLHDDRDNIHLLPETRS
jgi:hypothetical protein